MDHESPAIVVRPDSVNGLLCEWRDARLNLYKWSVGDKELRGAVDRLADAECSLHQFAMTLGAMVTESGGKEQTNSRDAND